MNTIRSNEVVNAFLSCSIRPRDWPLVSAIEEKVLNPMGFRCFTIGRNVSLAEQTDDAIRRLIESCDCLIGIATERLNATDRDFQDKTLSLATPYLLQETSMAFQSGLPFLIFKTTNVTLLGITNRNLCLEIDGQLSEKGKPRFRCKQESLSSALQDLKQKALNRRKQIGEEKLKSRIGTLSTLIVGGYGLSKGIDWLLRPDCFGYFHYKEPACKDCNYRGDCKIKKAQINRR